MLSAPEAVAVLALAVTCAEPFAVSTAAKALGKHVDTLPDASASASTQQIVTAQQHLLMALPTAASAAPAEWAAQRDSIVRMCRGADEVRAVALVRSTCGLDDFIVPRHTLMQVHCL